MNQPIDCIRYLNQYTARQSICQIGLNMYRLLASPKLPLDMTTAEAWIDILCSCVHGYICFHIAKHSLQYRKNQRNLPFTYPTLNKKNKTVSLDNLTAVGSSPSGIEIFHVRKLSSYLREGWWSYSSFCPCLKQYPVSSFTRKNWRCDSFP